jgi:hypothetical protein
MNRSKYALLASISGLSRSKLYDNDVGESTIRKSRKPLLQNTQEHRDWNTAIDAKRKAKKAKK